MPKLWCDNLNVTCLTGNPIFHTRTRHLEIEFQFVRDLVSKKQLPMHHISTSDQIADVLTKALTKETFQRHRSKLTIRPTPICLKGDKKTLSHC